MILEPDIDLILAIVHLFHVENVITSVDVELLGEQNDVHTNKPSGFIVCRPDGINVIVFAGEVLTVEVEPFGPWIIKLEINSNARGVIRPLRWRDTSGCIKWVGNLLRSAIVERSDAEWCIVDI